MDKKIDCNSFNQEDLISVLNICHNSLMNAYCKQQLLNEELLSVSELAQLTCAYLKSKNEG